MVTDLSAHGSHRLSTRICRPSDLSRIDRSSMCALLNKFFDNVVPSFFEHDLDEKESLILLIDDHEGAILGFTTLMRFDTIISGQRVVAFYSGDTIADPDTWRTTYLHRSWAHHVWDQARQAGDARVFWFLVSCGYRTYRFLPVFFNSFYPRQGIQMPEDIAELLETFAFLRFPNEYDRDRGVVRFAHPTPIRSGVSDVTPERLRDPHIAFYVAANPGYVEGQGLACLAEISRDNLTAAARRLLRS